MRKNTFITASIVVTGLISCARTSDYASVTDIRNLEPKCVWTNFYSLTQVPRPSGHEEKVTEFLVGFGKNLGLETYSDSVGNVLIRKPATPGMENRQCVILQGHMDIACVKDEYVEWDWMNEPVKPRIDGEWVCATGTTLGSDNGIGLGVVMAVLESKTLKHGPIEALFTVDEEVGKSGANALKPGMLNGRIMINVDSEEDGQIFVGAAGAVELHSTFKFKPEAVPTGFSIRKVTVSGLYGGYSGDIANGGANAVKLVARLALPLIKDYGCRIVTINGGFRRNAVPDNAEVVLAVPDVAVDAVTVSVNRNAEEIKGEYVTFEKGMEISIGPADGAGSVIPSDIALNVVRALLITPCGIDRMSLEVPGLVESSNSTTILKTESNTIYVLNLVRAANNTIKYALMESILNTFELTGAETTISGDYSGWRPKKDSKILEITKREYISLFGEYPEIVAIHAGLECGIIAGVCPGLDIVSFGPTILNRHTPSEKCWIPAVEKMWKLLVKVLEEIPESSLNSLGETPKISKVVGPVKNPNCKFTFVE